MKPSPAKKSFCLEDLALPHVPALQAYTPGKQPSGGDWTKLNTNECPYPPSPRVAEALTPLLTSGRLRLYPDPRGVELRRAIAEFYQLSEDQVLLGNGSDDILNLLVRAFCNARNGALFPTPGYSLYPTLVQIQNGSFREVPFTRDMELPISGLISGSSPDSRENLLFVTNPNAPTGVLFSQKVLRELLSRFPGLVVVDEAYGEFAKESAIPLLKEYPNLCVTRTFSKSYALAGCRLGYLLGSPDLIQLIDRIRDSYNVNALTQTAGLAALSDTAYYGKIRGKILATRSAFSRWCEEQSWFTYPSQANFIFTEPVYQGRTGADVAASAFAYLEKEKILVRYFPKPALTSSFLRISIGTAEQMARVKEALTDWQNSTSHVPKK